eukprot:TRINITY_DN906_c0_g1_i1.p1 TRINITY_DN906_c0_g1~~TRINITY_DN906_c0_g1_i1.p1  ORF type:complete len:241 (+),score=35.91 TRINITY_DN906_c0_g1_i1:85-807(+)
MISIMIEGWTGVAIHMALFPFMGVGVGVVFGFFARPYAQGIDGFSFQAELDFLLQNLKMIIPSLSLVSLLFLVMERICCYTRDYTQADLAILPVYCVVYLLLDDTSYYFVHRLMHSSTFLWKYVHKFHHDAEFTGTAAAICFHPLDFGSHFILPLVMHAVLFRQIHIYNLFAVSGILMFLGYYSHCGADVDFLSPFIVSPLFHQIHHKHRGNFATYTAIWDELMGTRMMSGCELRFLVGG